MNSQILVLIVAFLHILILSILRFFPYPELLVYPYLVENGLLPYKQIFDQHFPSFLMTPLNFYDFGLRSEFSARLFLLGSVAVSHLFIFLISKRFFKKEKFNFLPNLLYLIAQPLFEGNYLWLDTFLAPILLTSFYFCLRFLESETLKNAFWLGIFLGLTLFFKQAILPLILLVIIIIFLKTKFRMGLIVSVVSATIPVFLTVLWIFSKDLWGEFFYWTISFNFEVYSKMAKKFPTPGQFLGWWIVFLLPSLFLLFTKLKKTQLVLLFLYSTFSLIAVFPRFEFVHLQPSLPFAVLAASCVLFSNLKIKYTVIVLSASLFIVWWPVYLRVNLFKPSILFTPEILSVSKKVSSLTQENEKIFVLGAQPIVYTLSNRLPAGSVFTVNVPWNMRIAEETIHQRLLADPPKLVIRDPTASIDDQRVLDFSPKLNRLINEKYKLVEKVGENEILISK